MGRVGECRSLALLGQLRLDRLQEERAGVSFGVSRPSTLRSVKVDRQRVARLIARLALGIAVGAALAFLAMRYL